MLRRRKPTKDDFPRPWEDGPISLERWQRHRKQLMAWTMPGHRPQEWWLYERGRERPDENETAVLYAMGELRDRELAEVMAHWRDYHDRADDYEAAERRAWLKWAGIPSEFVKKWDAKRKRRAARRSAN